MQYLRVRGEVLMEGLQTGVVAARFSFQTAVLPLLPHSCADTVEIVGASIFLINLGFTARKRGVQEYMFTQTCFIIFIYETRLH
jgi:hypothetical protein